MTSDTTSAPVLKVHRAESAPSFIDLPRYQTPGAAGFDLHAANTRRLTLQPRERMLIPTGLLLEIPEGYEGQIRPRSGLALNKGVTVLNTPGTIDSDYRGEVGVVLINHGNMPFVINPGDRIAQMVIAPVTRVDIVAATDPVSATERGAQGYGSTGQS